jgi:hypothetical protein
MRSDLTLRGQLEADHDFYKFKLCREGSMKPLMIIAMAVTTIFINVVGCVSTQSQLMPAVFKGKTDTVTKLIAEGADVNEKNSKGYTAHK